MIYTLNFSKEIFSELLSFIFSTFFTLYVIPTIYLAIGKNTKSINHIEKELKKQLD